MRGKKGARSLERIDIRGVGYNIIKRTRDFWGVLGFGWILLDFFLDMEGGKGYVARCMGWICVSIYLSYSLFCLLCI